MLHRITFTITLLFNLFFSGYGQADKPLFQIIPQYTESELREIALHADPPGETGSFKSPALVELSTIIPDLRYDIRYAGTQNFMGMRFYLEEKAFMQKKAAKALKKVAKKLRQKGLGIIVYDAYRPWYVTKMFWEATPDSLKNFVANPENGSRHNRGCAIDLGLYDIETDEILPMPSGYDEFNETAFADYDGAVYEEKQNRDLLINTMSSYGFTVYRYEWWHFDFKDWEDYPILNLKFDEIN